MSVYVRVLVQCSVHAAAATAAACLSTMLSLRH